MCPRRASPLPALGMARTCLVPLRPLNDRNWIRIWPEVEPLRVTAHTLPVEVIVQPGLVLERVWPVYHCLYFQPPRAARLEGCQPFLDIVRHTDFHDTVKLRVLEADDVQAQTGLRNRWGGARYRSGAGLPPRQIVPYQSHYRTCLYRRFYLL
jgi:hypothetical protein